MKQVRKRVALIFPESHLTTGNFIWGTFRNELELGGIADTGAGPYAVGTALESPETLCSLETSRPPDICVIWLPSKRKPDEWVSRLLTTLKEQFPDCFLLWMVEGAGIVMDEYTFLNIGTISFLVDIELPAGPRKLPEDASNEAKLLNAIFSGLGDDGPYHLLELVRQLLDIKNKLD